MAALQGIIRCQLLEGQLEEAEQQLGFLVDIEASLENKSVRAMQHLAARICSPVTQELSYLGALLSAKRQQASDTVIAKLDQAADTFAFSHKYTHFDLTLYNIRHLGVLELHAFTEAFIKTADPDLMLEMVKLYLDYGPNEAPQGQTTSPILQKANVGHIRLIDHQPFMC